MANEIVSREDQERMGLLRQTGMTKFVAAHPEQQRLLPPTQTSYNTALDVPANAVQVVSVQTTERDRSAGYLMRTIPLSVAFAFVVTVVAVTLSAEPFFSWLAFIIFWLSFVGAWAFGEYRLGKSSPFAANIMEIQRKWDNIDANDRRRWDLWEKATGFAPSKEAGSWVERYKGAIIVWAAVTLVWMVFVTLVLLGEP